jgi:hypothetical protein
MAGQKREARLRARCPGHPRLHAWPKNVDARDKPGHDVVVGVCSDGYLIGGAYWMPPAFQSWFMPRGICSLEPLPILRSYISP